MIFKKKPTTLQKASTEGTYLNIINHIYDKYAANIILNSENIPFKIRNLERMTTLTTLHQQSYESPNHSNQRKKKEIKGIQVGEVKLPLFLDDMMLLTENPKDATSKLFELISEFGKAAGYKTNILKSVAFPYTNNKKIKRRD